MYRTFVLGFLFIFFGCYSKKNIELVNYEKIVSHRNKGLAYLEEENFTEAEKQFKELIKFSKTQSQLGDTIGVISRLLCVAAIQVTAFLKV